jgi:hypothetical protein
MVVRGNRGRPLLWFPQARSGPSGREDGLHGPKAIRVAEGTLRERGPSVGMHLSLADLLL